MFAFLLAETSAFDAISQLVGFGFMAMWFIALMGARLAKKSAGNAAKGAGSAGKVAGRLAGRAVTTVYRDHGKDILGHFLNRK